MSEGHQVRELELCQILYFLMFMKHVKFVMKLLRPLDVTLVPKWT